MRRRASAADIPTIDIYSFLLSDGCDGLTMGNVAANPEEARRAWPAYRRRTWSHCSVGDLPQAALIHDELTTTGERMLRHEWDGDPYPAEDILAALGADRAAVERFRQRDPAGAASIAEFLLAFCAALDAYAAEAARVAAGGERKYPIFAFKTQRYGEATTVH